MAKPKPFPNREKIEFKPAFEERYKQLLGDNYNLFKEYSLSFLRKCIRVNTLKAGIEETRKRIEKKGWTLTQVPWCREGFWIEGTRLDIGNLEEHQLGYIYVQESASMIPPVVLFQDSPVKEGEVILDIAAAPGSKTSQIAQYMNNKGLLIANELDGKRIKALGINLQKCGIHNTIITHMDGLSFNRKNIEFDRILVDAPCSGTGTIRKSTKCLSMWSPCLVKKMARIQSSLLNIAFRKLKEGGILVYSTCTQEPEENEGIISSFLENNPSAYLEEIKPNINRSKPVLEFNGIKYSQEVKKCLRIYPQDNDSEGFFVARIRKR